MSSFYCLTYFCFYQKISVLSPICQSASKIVIVPFQTEGKSERLPLFHIRLTWEEMRERENAGML